MQPRAASICPPPGGAPTRPRLLHRVVAPRCLAFSTTRWPYAPASSPSDCPALTFPPWRPMRRHASPPRRRMGGRRPTPTYASSSHEQATPRLGDPRHLHRPPRRCGTAPPRSAVSDPRHLTLLHLGVDADPLPARLDVAGGARRGPLASLLWCGLDPASCPPARPALRPGGTALYLSRAMARLLHACPAGRAGPSWRPSDSQRGDEAARSVLFTSA